MQGERIQRVLVWSASLRLAHWLIALSVILLSATGWLIQSSPMTAETASDFHDFFSAVLIFGLGLRAWNLVFGSGSANWRQLVPQSTDNDRMLAMLRFYLTFGKSPLPNWYAHNPLWAPVYLLLFTALLIQVLSGLLMETVPLLWIFYLPDIHGWLAKAIFLFFLLHIVAVVLHDLKGSGSDISAIINGHRIFVSDRPEQTDEKPVQFITPDQLKKRK